jgi:hypothetical protein
VTKWNPDGTPVPGTTTYRSMPQRAKYSRRDYEIFAHMLKGCKPMTTVDNKDPANQAWAAVVAATAELFHEDNSEFNVLRFTNRIHEHETST